MTQIAPTRFHNRRSFLTRAFASTAAVQGLSMAGLLGRPELASAADNAPNVKDRNKQPVCMFAKHLQFMPWGELAKFCREVKVDGIEATIRRRGQVAPVDAVEKMPKLCDALAETDTRIVIMATDINSPNSPHAEAVLKTGAALGVTHYRMSYFKYDLTKPIRPQLDKFARDAAELAAMNRDLGLTGLYQNHSGANYVGGPLWDLQQVLGEIPTSDIAVAYDVRHATVEGNLSWPIDLAMIRERIGAVYAKDFRAINGKIQNVPLGDGDVSDQLFAALRQQPPPGPISLHMEYISHTDPTQAAASVNAYRKDRETLRQLLGV